VSALAELPVEVKLAEEMGRFYADPLGFVRFAYPWGERGPLQNESGPDAVQEEFLHALGAEVRARRFDGEHPVAPVRMCATSGHGTGKTAMGAWIANWILSTRPHSIGTITAGTYTQLEDRTWAALKWWTSLAITAHWFHSLARTICHREFRDTWKVVAQTCKEENAQYFSGQHARNSTSWYLLDEASEVPDKIWETAEGGLTDGEPMIFAWGQAVRNRGEFHRVCFGDKVARWNHRRIDSRASRFTNRDLIAQWAKDYGEESDFFRVRVLGYAPEASELQYIDRARIAEAVARAGRALVDDPLVAGFDVSGGGKAWNVIRFRRGLDGKNVPPAIRLPGESDPDRSQRTALCAELLAERRAEKKLAMLFVDAAFGAPIVERLKALGHTNVCEVNFGGASPDHHCANQRAYMWKKAKDWLLLGALAGDGDLCEQLALPGYHINPAGKLVIESKEGMAKRGEKSPDDADAFALTFAQAVAPASPERVSRTRFVPASEWS
jgi:hypothetical protein